MRVGILTFHYYPNYGAVLQALGLQTALIELGHEPVFLSYVPNYIRGRVSLFRRWGLRSGFRFFDKFRQRVHEQKRRNGFSRFRKDHLSCSVHLSNKRDLAAYCENLDAVIVGSDQVWNLRWQTTFDDTYFLGFLPDSANRIRRIAYAPCFGHPEQPQELLEQAKACIAKFDFVGMRNQFGQELLNGMGVRGSTRVVDPGFFLPRRTVQSAVFDGGVIVYAVSSSTAELCGKLAHIAAEKLKQPIRQIASETPISLRLDNLELVRHARPDDWLSLVSNAAFVCSESFHGVVFALANGVPFVAASEGLRAHRIRDLLTHYGLQSRLIENDADADAEALWKNLASPAQIQERLAADISISKEFLTKALA